MPFYAIEEKKRQTKGGKGAPNPSSYADGNGVTNLQT